MERRDDAARIESDDSPLDRAIPATPPAEDDALAGAREALRATPNQHSFEDEDPGDDAAWNYHGVDDGA